MSFLQVDISKLEKDLERFNLENNRKLQNAVEMFAVDIAKAASQKTPIGDESSLVEGTKYYGYYDTRAKNLNIPIEVGYHKGAWQYSESGMLDFTPAVTEVSTMLDDVLNIAQMEYKLGDTFTVGAIGPGYAALENDSSLQTNGQGIMQPALDVVTSVFAVDITRHYQNG